MDQVVRARGGYAPRGGDETSQELLDESLDHLPSSLLWGYTCYQSHNFVLSRVKVILETKWLKLARSYMGRCSCERF